MEIIEVIIGAFILFGIGYALCSLEGPVESFSNDDGSL